MMTKCFVQPVLIAKRNYVMHLVLKLATVILDFKSHQ